MNKAVSLAIPKHNRNKLDIVTEVSKLEMMNRGVSGNMRYELRQNLKELGLVLVPSPANYKISLEEKEKIEKLAYKAIRKNNCIKPEYFPVPAWIKEKSERKRYYLARLEMEIALRRGYVSCQKN